ncbi:hypothetical protein GCM10027271_43510 [Saccharopolyspora gloriosae]|uniref:PLL-like beta propeller domain-containing protein n=1 Tax=Saccharopolyspora gloriosae TaxID=455344 RepID=A0A840NEJ5_9PSEU|nr:hypothetical protein [Saccharopolyspora gloriosae]MBB5070350.1 hypothetical protein [Saccharopolyspora gloriosae]
MTGPEEHPPADPDRAPRKDRRFMLAAGLGGIGLIVTPPAVFALLTNARHAQDDPAARPRLSPDPGGPVHSDEQNRIVVLAKGTDLAVLRNHQSTSQEGATGDWLDLGERAAGQPIGIIDRDGRLAAFVINTAGVLRYAEQIAPSEQAAPRWRSLGGGELVGSPAAAQNSAGLLVVAARDRAGALWETHQYPSGGWSEPHRLPGPPVRDDPVLRTNPGGALALFALGRDGRVRAHSEQGSNSGEWLPASDIPGTVETSPATIIDKQQRQRLYSIRADGTMWENVETAASSGQWRGWREFGLGGPFAGRPVTVADGNNTLVVLARHEDGTVWERFQRDRADDRWSLWKRLHGDLAELVGAAQDANGVLVVFGIGRDGVMQRNYQVKGQRTPWSGWHADFGGEFPKQRTP